MNPIRLQIAQAARETDQHPSDGQIKAGNYRKGSFAWNGMQIVIENPKGSTRSGGTSLQLSLTLELRLTPGGGTTNRRQPKIIG